MSNGVAHFLCSEVPYRTHKLAWALCGLIHYLAGVCVGGPLEARVAEADTQDQHDRAGVGPVQLRDQVHLFPGRKPKSKTATQTLPSLRVRELQ